GITVDLPIALDPKVTGAEKVKAALQSALETGLGAALGGAVFGKMLGLTAGAGALAGVGLAAGAALTILIIHDIKRRADETADRVAALRESARSLIEASSLPATLTPEMGKLGWKGDPIEALADSIYDLGGIAEPSADQISAMVEELQEFYDKAGLQYTLKPAEKNALALSGSLLDLATSFGISAKSARDFATKFLAEYGKSLTSPRITPSNMGFDALVDSIMESARNAAANTEMALLSDSDIQAIARYAAENLKEATSELRSLAITAGFSGDTIDDIVGKITDVAISMSEALTPEAAAAAAGELVAMGQALAQMTESIPNDAKYYVLNEIMSRIAYLPEGVLELLRAKMPQTEQEWADYFTRLLSGAANIPSNAAVKTTAQKVADFGAQMRAVYADLADGNTTLEKALELYGQLSTGYDDWSEKLTALKAAGDPAAEALQDVVAWLESIIDPAEKAATIPWSTQIGELKAGLTAPLMEDQIAAIGSLKSIGKELFALAEDPAYARFAPALNSLIDSIEAAGIAIRDAVMDPALTEAWKSLSQSYSSGQLALDDFIAGLKDSASASDDYKAALVYFYEKLQELSGEMDNSVAIQQFFQAALGVSESAARDLASALGGAASAARNLSSVLGSLAMSEVSGILGEVDKMVAELQSGTVAEANPNYQRWQEEGGYEGSLIAPSETRQREMKVDEAIDRLSQLNAVKSAVDSMRESGWDLGLMDSPAWKEIESTFDALGLKFSGLNPEEMADEVARAAAEAQRAAEDASAAAKQAAEEAAQAAREAAEAEQKAFEDQFLAPMREAMKTGDWYGAAESVRSIALAREDFVKMAASLSDANDKTIDEAQVLDMILGARQKLLSALENEIEYMRLIGEDAAALEELKAQIENLFDPLGAFKQYIRDILGIGGPQGAFDSIIAALRGAVGHMGLASPKIGLASGGSVPGTGIGDKIPAMLEPGEFVVPRWMMSIPGVGSLIKSVWSRSRRMKTGGLAGIGASDYSLGEPGWVCTGSQCYEVDVEDASAAMSMAATGYTSSCNKCAKANAQVEVAARDVTVAYEKVAVDMEARYSDLAAQMQVGDEAWSAHIDAAEELVSTYKTLYEQVDKFGGNTEEAGSKLAEIVDVMVGQKATLLNVDEGLARFYVALDLYGSKIVSAAKAVLPGDAGNIVGGVADIFSALSAGGGALDLVGPVASIAKAVISIGKKVYDSVRETVKQVEESISELIPDFSALCDAVGGAVRFVSGLAKASFNAASFVAKGMAQVVSAIGKSAYSLLSSAAEELGGIAQALYGWLASGVGKAFESTAKFISAVGTKVADFASGAIDSAVSAVETLGVAVSSVAKAFSGFVARALSTTASAVLSAGRVVAKSLASVSEMAASSLLGVLRSLFSALRSLPSLLKSVADRLVSFAGAIISAISSTETFSDLQGAVADLQRAAMNSLLEAILPITAILKKIIGLYDKEAESLSASLNVPTGYKVTNAEWKAATPGVPGIETGGEATGPSWLSGLLDKFGEAIDSAIKPVADFVSALSKAMEDIGGKVLAAILGPLDSFGKYLSTMAQSVLPGLISVLGTTLPSAATGGMNVILGAISAAMAGIATAITSMLPQLSKLLESLGKVGLSLPEAVTKLVSGIAPAANAFISALTQLVESISPKLIQQAASALASVIGGVGSILSGAFTGTLNGIIASLSSLLPPLSKFGAALGTMGDSVSKLFTATVSAAIQPVQGFVSSITSAISAISATLMPVLSSALPQAVNAIISLVAGALSGAISGLVKILAEALPTLSGVFSAIASVGNSLAPILAAVGSSVSSVAATFGTQLSQLAQRIAGDLLPKLSAALPAAISGAASLLSGTFIGALNAIVSVLSSLAPSLTSLGNTAKTVGGQLSDLFAKIGSALQPVAAELAIRLTDLAARITGQLMPALTSQLPSALSAIASLISNAFVGAMNAVIGVLSYSANSLSGFWAAIASISGKITDLFSSIGASLSP
ncbi:MAG: hypothetical protein WC565_06665, partial [Parcubacteria group bacterium]